MVTKIDLILSKLFSEANESYLEALTSPKSVTPAKKGKYKYIFYINIQRMKSLANRPQILYNPRQKFPNDK